MGRHEPPDQSRGDERTLGGYMAVHARPAAFEGADGRSYTVAIETDETGERARPIGGYLIFVRWGGEQPLRARVSAVEPATSTSTASNGRTATP